MKEIEDIRLVVVDEKPESAEAVSRIMRDGGQLLPVNWANSVMRLQKLLEYPAPTVVLANANLPWLPLDQISLSNNKLGCITVALGNLPDPSLELRALRNGALCVGSVKQPALLEQQILIAIKLTRLRLEQEQQKIQITHLRSRCDALLDTASEAIAYTSEGVITSANAAFAKLLGATSGVELIGRLISDFIAPESLYQFSRVLRQLMRGESDHMQMENSAINTLQGQSSAAMLLMHNVEIDGEHSTQILIRDCTEASNSKPETAVASPSSPFTSIMQNSAADSAKQSSATPQSVAPSLSLVSAQNSNEHRQNLVLKAPLEQNSLDSMMARLSAWQQQPVEKDSYSNSANDHFAVAPLPELVANHQAEMCMQPLMSVHADDKLLLARIKAGQTLMPISQMLEDSLDEPSFIWLLQQLQLLAKDSKLVLGPISKSCINAKSIELLQQNGGCKGLILGLSEQTLSADYHAISQFLLQLQKLDMKASIWMNSTPSVLSGVISDLSDSVRSGIHSVILNNHKTPTINNKQLQTNDWDPLFLSCEKHDIKIIAPAPLDNEQLQTWWRLGTDWCLTGDSSIITSQSHSGARSSQHLN